jgi:hypothetical protein
MMGGGANPHPFDIMEVSGGNMHNYNLDDHENDAVYEALTEYIMRNKTRAHRLMSVNYDLLNDDQVYFLNLYNKMIELQEKFEK